MRLTRMVGQLGLSILAAIAGTVLASVLNGSQQLRLAAAALGAAVPAFVSEPGRHQRERAVAAMLLMAVALFATYGGATLSSYATRHPDIFPIPKIVPPPSPTGTPHPPRRPRSRDPGDAHSAGIHRGLQRPRRRQPLPPGP